MNVIELQPLGDIEPAVLDSLIPALENTFGVATKLSRGSIRVEQFYDEQRGQYNSTAILQYLKHVPTVPAANPRRDCSSVIGVTRHDLFIPILTYVFGEAELGGDVAVVSYHRFCNELYGLAPDKDLMIERLRKVTIHEIAHTLGLVHCTAQSCVMHAASYVEELDLKGHEFCRLCRSLVKEKSQVRR